MKMKSQLAFLLFVLASSWALPLQKTYSPVITRLSEMESNTQTDSEASVLSYIKSSSDPEITMGPAELIQRWGYPVERHDVITQDGYILSVYRIPHGKNETEIPKGPRPVVFLQHGLEGCCTNWLTNLPQESAGYIFADAGFDVWMGNFRGTTYSKTHVTLSNKDHAYWQFSWDEMAQYDLPAMIHMALNVSGVDTLYYVGHSMGTMTAFAKFSDDQVLAKKIKQFYALAPIHTLKHVKGLLRYVAPMTRYLQDFFAFFGIDEFLPSSWMTETIAKYFCGNPLTDLICTNFLFVIAGPNTHQLNSTRMPVYVAHSPAGTSVQNIAHFGQMVESGKFDRFDWGSAAENKKHYNQSTPPVYDISKMQVPTGVYWGEEDWLADQTDVESATPLIRNLITNVFLDDFNHLDFIWGLRAAPEVYHPLLNSILEDWKDSRQQ